MARKKEAVIIIMCIIMLTLCSACNKIQSDPGAEAPTAAGLVTQGAATAEPTLKIEITEKPENTAKPTPINSVTVKPKELQPIQFYTADPITAEIEVMTALVSSTDKVTADFIVSLVTESMEEDAISVVVEEILSEGDTVIVSFDEDSRTAIEESMIEDSILDAIAQSLLDNIEECNKVVYRIMGGAYVTAGHDFGVDYVYMEKK